MLHVWIMCIYKLIHDSNYSLLEDKFSSEGSDSKTHCTIECVGDACSNEEDASIDDCMANSSNSNSVCTAAFCTISYDPVQVTESAVINKTQNRQCQTLGEFNPEWYRAYPGLFYAPPYSKRIAHGVDTVKTPAVNTKQGR